MKYFTAKFRITLLDTETKEKREIPWDHYFLTSKDIEEIKNIPLDINFLELSPEIEYVSRVCFLWEEHNLSCDCNRYDYFYGKDRNVNFPCDGDRFELLSIKLDKIAEESEDL